MKKFTLLFGLASFGSAAFAAPVGNPAFPQLLQDGYFIPCNSWVDLRLGYEGDFISDALLHQYHEGHGRIDLYEQYTNSGTLTLNFVDRLDLFGVFGSSRVCTNWRYAYESTVNRIAVETGYHFLWAVGGRGILFEWGCTTLGLGGRYSAAHFKPASTTVNGTPISSSGTELKWKEWQIDLDLSYKVDIFVPYVGVKYSNTHTMIGEYSVPINSSGSGSLHMNNHKPVGIMVGCSLTTGKYFFLNVEARLIDEMAATISGDFRF